MAPISVLVVCQSVPTREARRSDGTSLIAREIIALAPEQATVDLLAFARPGDSVEPAVVDRCRTTTVLPHRRERFRRQHLITAWSEWAWEIGGPAARAAVARGSAAVDVTLLVGPQTLSLATAVRGPLVVCEVDPWAAAMETHADTLPVLRRTISRAVTRRGDRAIRRIAATAAGWAVVSATDAERQTRRLARPVTAVPNGVDVGPARTAAPRRTPPVLGFVGSLSFGPNVEAVDILTRDVLPAVRRKLPGTTLLLAGRNPAPEVLAAVEATPGTVLLPDFDDIGEVLDRVDVMVFPDRSGFGVRNSVLEAVAAHLPVVATEVAGRGQPALLQLDLVPPDPTAVVAACLRVLASEQSFEAARQRSRTAAAALPRWGDSVSRWWQLLDEARRAPGGWTRGTRP